MHQSNRRSHHGQAFTHDDPRTHPCANGCAIDFHNLPAELICHTKDNITLPRRYSTDMKTNPLNLSRMIATTLAVIALPSFAQDAPKPDVPNGEPRMMRPSGDRMPNRTAADAPKPWRIGLIVEPLDPALRNHLDIPEKSGVVVSQCLANGPAAKAGIKNKDIILSANGRPVDSLEPLREIVEVSAKTGKELRLAVITKGVRRDVVIKPEMPKPDMQQPRADRELRPRIVPPLIAPMSDAKVRDHEPMIRRMAEQHNQLKSQIEKQQNDMTRMREAIEQLSKAVREMKQELKEADKE